MNRVVQIVQEAWARRLGIRLSPEETALADHLRGNERLMTDIRNLIDARITGRAQQAVPSDPVVCRGLMERDAELRWLLGRLDAAYRSPVDPPADGEQPA